MATINLGEASGAWTSWFCSCFSKGPFFLLIIPPLYGWRVKSESAEQPSSQHFFTDDNDVVRAHLLLKSSQLSLEQQQLNSTCTMLYSKYYKVDVNKFQVCFGFLFKCPPQSSSSSFCASILFTLSFCCQHLSLGTCAIKWLTWWNVEEGSFIAIFIPWGALCLLLFLRTIILTRLWSKRYLNVISKEKGEYFGHFWQFWLWQVRRSSRPNRNAFLPHHQYIWFWTKIYFPNSDDTNIRSCQNSYGFGWAANRPPINHKIVYWKTNCFLMLLMLWI